MLYLVIKAAISGVIIAIVSEVSRRSPTVGALVVSLPLVSILAMIWLWRDTGEPERLAAHAQATFWYVLPSLPMFLFVPWLLRRETPFYVALLLGCGLTVVLYGVLVWLAPRLGLRI